MSGPTVLDGTTCSYDYNCDYGVAAVSEDAPKKQLIRSLLLPLPVRVATVTRQGGPQAPLDGYTLQARFTMHQCGSVDG